MNDAVGERETFLIPFATLERELQRSGPDWLRGARRAAIERFGEIGFPSTRDEEWKATSVAPIARSRFRPAPAANGVPADLHQRAGVDPQAATLLFVDGRFQESLSAPPSGPAGVWYGNISRALEELPERLRDSLTVGASGAFEALNSAFWEDGAVVLIDDGVDLDRPIQIIYCSTGSSGDADPTASHPRTLIVAGASSRATVVESYLGVDGRAYLTNAATDVRVGAGARLRHYRVQAESEAAFHISSIRSRQERDSDYASLNLDLGGRLVRHDVRAVLDGEGGNCDLDGLYLTRGKQHVDNHTTIDHARPQCTSRETYKGVLAGESRTVFNGRIIVRPGAQQIDARQSNPNLLLTTGATAHTRPQLEIYADDVKCTHGATVGRLQEDEIFYLRSRGIPATEARDLLVSAFAGEILDRITIESLRLRLTDDVARRLPTMKGRSS